MNLIFPIMNQPLGEGLFTYPPWCALRSEIQARRGYTAGSRVSWPLGSPLEYPIVE